MTSNWQNEAACNSPAVNPDWFFPAEPGKAGNKAKAICGTCAVRNECLALALAEPVRGIWGGTSEAQRVTIRRQNGTSLPSGWPSHKPRTRWEDRYLELRDLGYSDFDVLRKLAIKPASLLRQLNRYNITPSPELIELAAEKKRVTS